MCVCLVFSWVFGVIIFPGQALSQWSNLLGLLPKGLRWLACLLGLPQGLQQTVGPPSFMRPALQWLQQPGLTQLLHAASWTA